MLTLTENNALICFQLGTLLPTLGIEYEAGLTCIITCVKFDTSNIKCPSLKGVFTTQSTS